MSQILTDTDFIEDPEEREAGIGPLIDEAIADADGEIDGYLAKRYAVPSPGSKGHQQVFQGHRPL
ncbi:MAG: phage protein Gp36 family protein [Dysosmobacter welbionis]